MPVDQSQRTDRANYKQPYRAVIIKRWGPGFPLATMNKAPGYLIGK